MDVDDVKWYSPQIHLEIRVLTKQKQYYKNYTSSCTQLLFKIFVLKFSKSFSNQMETEALEQVTGSKWNISVVSPGVAGSPGTPISPLSPLAPHVDDSYTNIKTPALT